MSITQRITFHWFASFRLNFTVSFIKQKIQSSQMFHYKRYKEFWFEKPLSLSWMESISGRSKRRYCLEFSYDMYSCTLLFLHARLKSVLAFQFQQLSRMQPPRANDEIKIQLKIAIKESMQENLERNRDSIHTCIRHLHEKML